ncbi:MAG: methylmalonyl Co-A mutase-associated GTPase MeaB [Acidobacteria bacterium]|nr:methylmalonyl Co-A mutase-associated GTPase MeaB [Acidobacteriota bacterium]
MRAPWLDNRRILEGLLARDRSILARAITLVESTRDEDRKQAEDLVDMCLPHAGTSIRIGISGVPGVGKSTFIEAIGREFLREPDAAVAVLAVDPSSPLSGGSILGDKTRMAALSSHPRAFIRPSPSSGGLGGVQRRTRETIVLCEAAGFDTILVETVGVGQSEFAVASMTDCFLLLLLANAGDELQGIKRGIMELCDVVAINKADGGNAQAAEVARKQYESAVHYLGRQIPVLTCSALTGHRIPQVMEKIGEFFTEARKTGSFQTRRAAQNTAWMEEAVRLLIEQKAANAAPELRERVARGEISPAKAARLLVS